MWLRHMQEGESKGMQQDGDKILVRERKSNEIDGVMNCERKNMDDRGFKVEDDLALCRAHAS